MGDAARAAVRAYTPVLVPRRGSAGDTSTPHGLATARHLLIVDVGDGSQITLALIAAARGRGLRPIVLQRPSRVQRTSAPSMVVAGGRTGDLEAAVVRMADVRAGLAGIIVLHTVDRTAFRAEHLEQVYAILAIARGLAASSHRPPVCQFVTAQGGGLGVDGAGCQAIAPAIEAMCKPLAAELPDLAFASLDVSLADTPTQSAELILDELAAARAGEAPIAGRTSVGEVQLALRELADLPAGHALNADSVVVFAGGARGIGAVCARRLAAETSCQVIFLGRTRLSDEAHALARLPLAARQLEMQRFVRDYRGEHPTASPRASRDAWRARQQAADVLDGLSDMRAEYYSVDIRNAAATLATLRTIKGQYGRIDLIVHLAGLGGSEWDGRIAHKEWTTIHDVIETKALGAAHLLSAANALEVPRYISFGSIASRIGNAGQVDYAAANGLLTGIARTHNATGRAPLASVVHWGAWDGVGMAARGGTREILAAQGVQFIPPEVGAARFTRLAMADPNALPAEVFITAGSPGLEVQLEGDGALLPEAVSPDRVVAQRLLDPLVDPLLRDHRFHGYVFVPAVLYLQVALEAASQMGGSVAAMEARDFRFYQALMLVREPRVLLVEAKRVSADETRVAFSSDQQGRRVLHAEGTLVQRPIADGSTKCWTDVIHEPPRSPGVERTRDALYPDRFPHGPTYRVLDRVTYYTEELTAAGSVGHRDVSRSAWHLPLTLIDGAFQVDSIARAGYDQPGGLPRIIGRMCWTPEFAWAGSLECIARVQPDHPEQPAEIVLFDAARRTASMVISDFRTTASLSCLHPEPVQELA